MHQPPSVVTVSPIRIPQFGGLVMANPTSGAHRFEGEVSSADRRLNGAVDPFEALAAATEVPTETDRVLAETFRRMRRMADALRRLGEELAVERQRTATLRGEIARLRREDAALRSDRSGVSARAA